MAVECCWYLELTQGLDLCAFNCNTEYQVSAIVSFALPGPSDDFWRVDFHSEVGTASIQGTKDAPLNKDWPDQSAGNENLLEARTKCILYNGRMG